MGTGYRIETFLFDRLVYFKSKLKKESLIMKKWFTEFPFTTNKHSMAQAVKLVRLTKVPCSNGTGAYSSQSLPSMQRERLPGLWTIPEAGIRRLPQLLKKSANRTRLTHTLLNRGVLRWRKRYTGSILWSTSPRIPSSWRVAQAHADTIIAKVKKMICSAEQKKDLIDAICT